ncbi:PssD/Cps14F family polysaccharide biosynthesis glycosyltransferase [Waltera intestinalis]|uniref:Polysaccharide biosynthesis protein n=1 Tax=Waltera intestinalis TaxID=2606635 RepID=A0A6L5YJJ2_9FIRM|nr:PssD/Cps14F family polysaccharide biosynthesis glycosyltransferase [Waltera intestinalis]MST58319.1 polysaccharide biosynthesis protein [Waltera intestinalis]
MKICFVASSGGHLEEICRLKNVAEKYDNFLVTEKNDFEVRNFGNRQHYVPQMNRREKLFLFKFIRLFYIAFRILIKEKPDFVITTGALIAYPFCVLEKIMHGKVIYIESFARVNKPSLTGKMVHRYADLFLVQWEDMLDYFPDAVLGGGIF